MLDSTPDRFAALVAEGNLAPSVHNTQPTRWRLQPDGSVLVLEDANRRLPVGDPHGRDADVSHGSVIEGFALACAAHGWGVEVVAEAASGGPGLRPVAQLRLQTGAAPDALQAAVRSRRTYRGKFAAAGQDGQKVLAQLAREDDVVLVTEPEGIAHLARLNDTASLRTFRDRAFRAELLSWMRLSPRDPRWLQDGLNAQAMEMSGLEAAAAGFVLKPGVFEALDRIGLAPLAVAEAPVVRSALAIVLFHRASDEPPLATGRRFHRLWLEFERLGLSAAPMAVLADDPQAEGEIRAAFDVPPGRRLITAFRLGAAPLRDLGPKPRLPVSTLLA